MARPRSTETYHSEANIWPAVTDSILLMASIFIVLSVVALASIASKVDDQAGAGQEPGDKVICEVVGLSADLLFRSGQSDFKTRGEARKKLVQELETLAPKLAALKRYAKTQKDWNDEYYLVLEVSGHTDVDPLPGSRQGDDGNWDLAAQRAVTVVHELEDILRNRKDLQADFNVRLPDASSSPNTQTAEPSTMVLRVAGYSSHLPSVAYPGSKLDKPGMMKAKDWNRRVELRVYAQPVYVLRTELKAPR